MESVDVGVLQQFRLDRFLAANPVVNLPVEAIFSAPKEDADLRLFFLAERFILLALGDKAGYFPRIDEGEIRYPRDLPPFFQRYFYDPYLVIIQSRQPFNWSRPFQAALLIAEEFNEANFCYLQRALQEPGNSTILDSREVAIYSEGVWALLHSPLSFTNAMEYEIDNLGRCAVGFMQMVETLSAFERLGSENRSGAEAEFDGEGELVRRLVAGALRWRVDLHDERVVRRLSNLAALFYEMCGREFEGNGQAGLQWSPRRSGELFDDLLGGWKESTAPGRLGG
jgi:hypothetical protein